MRILSPVGYALSAAAAIALLAGCSGGSTTGGTSLPSSNGAQSQVRGGVASTSVLRPGVTAKHVSGSPLVNPNANPLGGTVWVSDSGTNQVFQCKKKGCKSVGSGWSEPQGLAADKHGNVYVADTINSRIVELDKKGNTVATLNDAGEYPAGVGVALDGTVGVTNICNSASCGLGNIVFYAPGSTSVTSTATGVNFRFYFGGFDSAGNFYNDGTDESGIIHVAVVAAGSTTNTDTGLGSQFEFPGGIEVANSGGKHGTDTLDVDDQEAFVVRQYSLPSLSSVGSVSLGGSCDPVTFGLTSKDKYLWTADACTASANQYIYPTGGSPNMAISGFSEPIGVAIVKDGED